MGGSGESKSVRGHSLRVFVDFLKANDPGLKQNNSGHFAGLQRIGDPNDGTALWTMLSDAQQIKNAIEKRAIDREAELHDQAVYEEQGASLLALEPPPLPPVQPAEVSATRNVAVDRTHRSNEIAVAMPAPEATSSVRSGMIPEIYAQQPAVSQQPLRSINVCSNCQCVLM